MKTQTVACNFYSRLISHCHPSGPEFRWIMQVLLEHYKWITLTKLTDLKKKPEKTYFKCMYFLQVQEFYDKRVADGIFPDPCKKKSGTMSLQEISIAGVSDDSEDKEAQQKEKLQEEDDENYIENMRAQDEYKDDHRRGWGNRMNRS